MRCLLAMPIRIPGGRAGVVDSSDGRVIPMSRVLRLATRLEIPIEE